MDACACACELQARQARWGAGEAVQVGHKKRMRTGVAQPGDAGPRVLALELHPARQHLALQHGEGGNDGCWRGGGVAAAGGAAGLERPCYGSEAALHLSLRRQP